MAPRQQMNEPARQTRAPGATGLLANPMPGGLRLTFALASVGVAGILLSDTACSVLVNTDANQCTPASVETACASFPGLRKCSANVCEAVTVAPSCTATTCRQDGGVGCTDCTAYANASCVSGSCLRSCTTAAECGGTSKCTAGTCSAASAESCKVNADCASEGPYYICRKDTRTCVNLASAECTSIYGKYKDDNAFIFGSVLPTGGPDTSTGQPLEQAIELAIDDFTNTSGGLLPSTGATSNRPLVVVSCNDNSDNKTAEAATNHLVNDLGIQAVIGSAFSGITTDIATAITIPAGALLFSPSATAATLSTLNDNGLFWRTSPSDNEQSSALNLWFNQLVSTLVPAPSPLIVGAFYKADTYGSGLAQQLASLLQLNGSPAAGPSNNSNFVSADYGNPDAPETSPTKYDQVVNQALTLKPHVIFLLGTNEAIHNVMEPIENQWPSSIPYRPRYIFSDGGELHDLAVYVAGSDDGGMPVGGIRTRISGTTPGSTGPVYNTFRQHFLGKYSSGSPDTFGTAGAYDIVYMLAYSAVGATSVAGTAPLPLTGANLVAGFSRVVSTSATNPSQIAVGTLGIGSAQAVMTTPSGKLALSGASGPLRYTITPGATGDTASDIQIWCVPTGQDPVASNIYYDPTSPQSLSGTTLGPQCN